METMFNVDDELVAYDDVSNLIDLAKHYLVSSGTQERAYRKLYIKEIVKKTKPENIIQSN
jgi:hypothetical protein